MSEKIKYLFTIFGEENKIIKPNSSIAKAFTEDWQVSILNANIRKSFKTMMRNFANFVYYKFVSKSRSMRFSNQIKSETRLGNFYVDYQVQSTISKSEFERNLLDRILSISHPITVSDPTLITSTSLRNAILVSMGVAGNAWVKQESESGKKEYVLINYIKLRSEEEYKSDRREIFLNNLYEK